MLARAVGGQPHLVHSVEVVNVLTRHRGRLHRQGAGRWAGELLHLEPHGAALAHRVAKLVEGQHAKPKGLAGSRRLRLLRHAHLRVAKREGRGRDWQRLQHHHPRGSLGWGHEIVDVSTGGLWVCEVVTGARLDPYQQVVGARFGEVKRRERHLAVALHGCRQYDASRLAHEGAHRLALCAHPNRVAAGAQAARAEHRAILVAAPAAAAASAERR